MRFHLAQRVHRDPYVRVWDIASTDPYVEICWGRVTKPRAARLAWCAAKLTDIESDRLIDGSEIWEALGEDPATDDMVDHLLVGAAMDASTQGLGYWSRDAKYSPDRRSFQVYDTVPLVYWSDLERLHDVELAHHVATVHNINERLGQDSSYAVWLPDWVYWRAGIDSKNADLADVRDALFDRGLPDWPSLRIDEDGSARGLTPPAGPSGGPSAHLAIPGWREPNAGSPADAGHPPALAGGVELSPGQQFYSTATGDRFEYLGDDAWRIVGGPHGVPSTVPAGGVVHQPAADLPAHWKQVRSEPASDIADGSCDGGVAGSGPDPAIEATQRRLDGLSHRRGPSSPGLGL